MTSKLDISHAYTCHLLLALHAFIQLNFILFHSNISGAILIFSYPLYLK